MKKIHIAGLAMGLFVFVMVGLAHSTPLWTNGIPLGGGHSNEINTSVSHSIIYDDFIIPEDVTWSVEALWSNNQRSWSGEVVNASWEIRSGITEGNGGTIVASGTTTANLVQVFDDIWNVSVNVDLMLGSGTYWLSVTPIGNGPGSGQFWVSITDGTGGVNALLNGSVYWDSETWNRDFYHITGRDYSFGVEGIATNPPIPEPATMLLLGTGLVGVAGAARRRKKNQA